VFQRKRDRQAKRSRWFIAFQAENGVRRMVRGCPERGAAVTILASYSKHRRDDVQPLPSGLAERLRRWLPGKPPDRPVFRMPEKPHRMFYRDVEISDVMKDSSGPKFVMGPPPSTQASRRIQTLSDASSRQARPVGFEPTTFGFEGGHKAP
jgi:hypothetical protein